MLIYDSGNKCRNLRQLKIRFSLIAEQIVAFALHPKIVREIETLPPNFKQIA